MDAAQKHTQDPRMVPVSYTHLDVYKRQGVLCAECEDGENVFFKK